MSGSTIGIRVDVEEVLWTRTAEQNTKLNKNTMLMGAHGLEEARKAPFSDNFRGISSPLAPSSARYIESFSSDAPTR